MPNNLVFNDSAQNLKVQTFGTTSGGTVTSLLVANDGTLQVGGSITVANTVTVAGSVTAAIADTVTVAGLVSVTANGFDIRFLSDATDTVSVTGSVTAAITDTVTVAGSVTAAIADTVTVAGLVSVTANSFDIRFLSDTTDTVSVTGSVTAAIANTVTVSVVGYGFTTSDLTINLTDAGLTNTAFSFDTSQMKQYSFYVVNTGAATISVQLQVSPTTTETFFVPDKTAEVALTSNQAAVLVPGYFRNCISYCIFQRTELAHTQVACHLLHKQSYILDICSINFRRGERLWVLH
jgi:hypothetical protein